MMSRLLDDALIKVVGGVASTLIESKIDFPMLGQQSATVSDR